MNIATCFLCESIFGPRIIGDGVRQLQTFNGYTVDFRLTEFRTFPPDALPEFIDFTSPEGILLCAEMHEEAIKQLHKQFGKEVFMSI